MEDQQHEFVLILAGYPREMDHFLSLNPGLPSRFPTSLTFKDFSQHELLTLLEMMVKEREYECSREALYKMKLHFEKTGRQGVRHFSNGRYVRNCVEKAIRMHAVRVMKQRKDKDRASLLRLEAEDFNVDEIESGL
ncbi:hypothetical protein ACFPU1_04430 [Thalassorhabdus alkalitolerans]|uniref:CbbX AAA lid domain-containing protein n=1 Tax=Thalassorhabdus alkalitolerans TaxID=2282697 RepID=A0ABW0YI36_9BACI|nr:hypothetical protein [Bacillus sp. FJAT-44742]